MSKKEILPIFSVRYWKSAALEFKNLRTLVFTALAIAASVALSAFWIPVGESLRIYFKFLPAAVGTMICGPLAGLAAGAIADLLGFVIFPTGAYFPGYTLSLSLSWLVYGLFFYRSRITLLRLVSAKVIVNYFINVGLGSLWSSIVMGKGYYVYFAASIVKNTLLLPLEVLLLFLLLRLLLPVMEKAGFVPATSPGSRVIPLI